MDFKNDFFKLFNNDWALLTAGTPEKFNTMTVSWGGLGALWSKPVATVYVRPNRYTYEFIEKEDRFTLSFYPTKYKNELMLLGKKSGRNENKVAQAGFTPEFVDGTVTFKEASRTLICKKLYFQDLEASRIPKEALDAYYANDPVHRMYIGEVLKILE